MKSNSVNALLEIKNKPLAIEFNSDKKNGVLFISKSYIEWMPTGKGNGKRKYNIGWKKLIELLEEKGTPYAVVKDPT